MNLLIQQLRMDDNCVRENIKLETFIKFLDAKARIILWKSETEKLFDGSVYQLYDQTCYNNMHITRLLFDSMSGISAIVSEARV